MVRPLSDHPDEVLASPRPLSGVPGMILGFIRLLSGVPRRVLGFIRPPSTIPGFDRPLSDHPDEILDPFDKVFVIQPSGVLITPTTPSAPLRGAVWAVPSGCRGYQSTSPSSLEETSMKPRTVGVIPPRASNHPTDPRAPSSSRRGRTPANTVGHPLTARTSVNGAGHPRAGRTRHREHPARRYGQVGAVPPSSRKTG
jgi:hypothetical protein